MTITGAPPQFPYGGNQPGADPSPGFNSSRAFANDLQGLNSPLASGDPSSSGGIKGLIRTLKRRQGVFVFAFALVTGALAADTLRQRIFNPVYEGGFQIQISNPFEQQASVLGAESKLETVARTPPKTDVPSLIVLMRSPLLVKPAADRMGVSMQEVIDNLSISPLGNVDQVLYVSLRWRDPAKGRQILTELSKDYTKFSQTQRQAALDMGVQFLNEQAPDINSRVVKYEAELKAFREKYNVMDPSSLASTIINRRDGLVGQVLELQVEQSDLYSKLRSAESGKLQWNPSGAPSVIEQMGRTGVIIPGRVKEIPGQVANGQSNPTDELSDFERQLANARAIYKDDSPIVQSIKAQRDRLLPVVRKQATDSLRAQLLANIAKQDELNRQILLLNENFRNSPALMRRFEELSQKLATARGNYNAYITARDNYRLQRARSTSPWQVIAPAEFADIPVEPNLQRNLMRALMFGLMAGVGAAILRERTDNVFHTPMEAEKDLQLPVLGLIPYLPLEPGVEISTSISKMSASERFAIKESLRSLFTTFRLLRADRDIRLVGVTSSTQGEGKSTAVTIFARTLADLGLKVLVVDSDLRLPMQTRYLGLAQGEGFSSVLTDSSHDIRTLIQPIQDNLDVLPAGPKPPDPAKLLNSSRAQEVINQIRDIPDYDIVLFDAPPCLMLADPILLGEKLDGILFLVGLGKVSRELAPQACRRIKATGVDVLGLICNQVNFPSRLNDYGYEYGYYYHYAYATSNIASRYSSTYGKGLGRYARGVGRYMRRYRDSYLADRYIKDGSNAAVRRYHEQGVSQELRQSAARRDATSNGNGNGSAESGQRSSPSSANGSGRTPDSGGGGGGGGRWGWLRRLPFRR